MVLMSFSPNIELNFSTRWHPFHASQIFSSYSWPEIILGSKVMLTSPLNGKAILRCISRLLERGPSMIGDYFFEKSFGRIGMEEHSMMPCRI
jgi:hypothetical protein